MGSIFFCCFWSPSASRTVIFFILWLCCNDCDVFHASGCEGACSWAMFFKLHVSALSFGPFFLGMEAPDCSKTGWTVSCQDGSEPSLHQPEATPTFWQLILRQKSVCNLQSHWHVTNFSQNFLCLRRSLLPAMSPPIYVRIDWLCLSLSVLRLCCHWGI